VKVHKFISTYSGEAHGIVWEPSGNPASSADLSKAKNTQKSLCKVEEGNESNEPIGYFHASWLDFVCS